MTTLSTTLADLCKRYEAAVNAKTAAARASGDTSRSIEARTGNLVAEFQRRVASGVQVNGSAPESFTGRRLKLLEDTVTHAASERRAEADYAASMALLAKEALLALAACEPVIRELDARQQAASADAARRQRFADTRARLHASPDY
jgi:hypothetical protein